MTETLTCRQCTGTFTRERTRGRKPHLCPECKASDGWTARPEDSTPLTERYSEDSITAGMQARSQAKTSKDQTDTMVLTGDQRAQRLTERMEPLHQLTRSDRQAQLDQIMAGRDYGNTIKR
jgi:hypothetical protein